MKLEGEEMWIDSPLMTFPRAVFLKNLRWVTTASVRGLFLIVISTMARARRSPRTVILEIRVRLLYGRYCYLARPTQTPQGAESAPRVKARGAAIGPPGSRMVVQPDAGRSDGHPTSTSNVFPR